jgi:hypothetical protein
MRLPVSWQQFVDPVGWMVGDPGQDIAEPDLRADVVQFGSDDQTVHRRGSLSAAIGTREQARFSAQGNPTQCSFSRIVAQADVTVVEKTG